MRIQKMSHYGKIMITRFKQKILREYVDQIFQPIRKYQDENFKKYSIARIAAKLMIDNRPKDGKLVRGTPLAKVEEESLSDSSSFLSDSESSEKKKSVSDSNSFKSDDSESDDFSKIDSKVKVRSPTK